MGQSKQGWERGIRFFKLLLKIIFNFLKFSQYSFTWFSAGRYNERAKRKRKMEVCGSFPVLVFESQPLLSKSEELMKRTKSFRYSRTYSRAVSAPQRKQSGFPLTVDNLKPNKSDWGVDTGPTLEILAEWFPKPSPPSPPGREKRQSLAPQKTPNRKEFSLFEVLSLHPLWHILAPLINLRSVQKPHVTHAEGRPCIDALAVTNLRIPLVLLYRLRSLSL